MSIIKTATRGLRLLVCSWDVVKRLKLQQFWKAIYLSADHGNPCLSIRKSLDTSFTTAWCKWRKSINNAISRIKHVGLRVKLAGKILPNSDVLCTWHILSWGGEENEWINMTNVKSFFFSKWLICNSGCLSRSLLSSSPLTEGLEGIYSVSKDIEHDFSISNPTNLHILKACCFFFFF